MSHCKAPRILATAAEQQPDYWHHEHERLPWASQHQAAAHGTFKNKDTQCGWWSLTLLGNRTVTLFLMDPA